MCGIAGVICPDPPLENLPDVLRRMQACLLHRGPDDRGIYVSRDGRAGLVHTRLAILDLSPLGHQPMSSVDGRFHITFNGEIYNFRELRQELEAEGEKFHTQSDTEVLLACISLNDLVLSGSLPGCSPSPFGMNATALAFWPVIRWASNRSITAHAITNWRLPPSCARWSIPILRRAAYHALRCWDTCCSAPSRSPTR